MDEKAKYGYSENDFLGFFPCILREKHIEDELERKKVEEEYKEQMAAERHDELLDD